MWRPKFHGAIRELPTRTELRTNSLEVTRRPLPTLVAAVTCPPDLLDQEDLRDLRGLPVSQVSKDSVVRTEILDLRDPQDSAASLDPQALRGRTVTRA